MASREGVVLKPDKVAYPPREGVVILVPDLLVDEQLNAGVWRREGSLRIAVFWELPQPLASIFHSTTMLGMEMPDRYLVLAGVRVICCRTARDTPRTRGSSMHWSGREGNLNIPPLA